MKKLVFLFLVAFSYNAVNAQEVDYHSVNFKFQQKPTLSLDPSIKTFNYKVFLSNGLEANADEAKRKSLLEKVGANLKIDLAPLTYDSMGGDILIVTTVHKAVFKSVTPNPSGRGTIITKAVNYYTTVYTKAGEIIASKHYNNEAHTTSFTENWSGSDVNKNDFSIQQRISSDIISASLDGFKRQIAGGPVSIDSKLADLASVKKYPELKVMEGQRKELSKLLGDGKLPDFVEKAKEFVPFWESQLGFNASEDSNEVRRAVCQNLALYYLLAGETEKAAHIIAIYKPFDKVIKEMFGLVKYRNSEKLEEILPNFENKVTPFSIATDGKLYTIDELIDRQRFTSFDGTVTLTGKKAGTYTGKFKFANPEPGFVASSGGIASLDAEDIEFTLTQANGEVIYGSVSKVQELKDASGIKYAVTKTGSALLGGATYNLLKEIFVSPKISVYKNALEASSDFLVKKAGDEKGVKTTLFNTKKNLKEYLADCTAVVATIDALKMSDRIDIEKIAKEYSSCN